MVHINFQLSTGNTMPSICHPSWVFFPIFFVLKSPLATSTSDRAAFAPQAFPPTPSSFSHLLLMSEYKQLLWWDKLWLNNRPVCFWIRHCCVKLQTSEALSHMHCTGSGWCCQYYPSWDFVRLAPLFKLQENQQKLWRNTCSCEWVCWWLVLISGRI